MCVSCVLYSGVMQLSCYRNHIYVLFVDGSVRKLSVLTATKLWEVLYAHQQWLRCAWLSLNVAACQLSRSALIGLSSHLRDAAHVDMAQVIADLALKVPDELPDAVSAAGEEADHVRKRQSAASSFRKLQSGIYSRVDEKLLDCDVECDSSTFRRCWSVPCGVPSKTKDAAAAGTAQDSVLPLERIASAKLNAAACACDGAPCNGSVDETAVDALSTVGEDFNSKCDLSSDDVRGAEIEVTHNSRT
jgi:hypothetical protein